jgi:hypothetical protein
MWIEDQIQDSSRGSRLETEKQPINWGHQSFRAGTLVHRNQFPSNDANNPVIQPYNHPAIPTILSQPRLSSLLSTTTLLATRWQHDSPLALLREANGSSVRQCRRLVAYTTTNKRVFEPHHEGHRQTVARHCPVAVGYR